MRHSAIVVGLLVLETFAYQSKLTVARAVESYAGGDFARAVGDLNTQRLTVTSLTTELDNWIAAGDPATVSRRRRVAASFALDTVWASTRTLGNAIQANADPWNATKADSCTTFVNRLWILLDDAPTTMAPSSS